MPIDVNFRSENSTNVLYYPPDKTPVDHGNTF